MISELFYLLCICTIGFVHGSETQTLYKANLENLKWSQDFTYVFQQNTDEFEIWQQAKMYSPFIFLADFSNAGEPIKFTRSIEQNGEWIKRSYEFIFQDNRKNAIVQEVKNQWQIIVPEEKHFVKSSEENVWEDEVTKKFEENTAEFKIWQEATKGEWKVGVPNEVKRTIQQKSDGTTRKIYEFKMKSNRSEKIIYIQEKENRWETTQIDTVTTQLKKL